MATTADHHRSDRHPAESYQQILERDSSGVPDYLREQIVPQLELDPIPVDRYFDPDFFRDEARYVWARTWQMACREEDIPNVNDCYVYELLNNSLIITRSAPSEIKAFHNSCLHRGRKLVVHSGQKSEFKCPYHGFSWHCDGRFKYNPIGWDFPQWQGKEMRLPEARVAVWGGYVFINLDLEAQPLEEVMAPLMRDLDRFRHEDRYRAAWVQKKIRANWKATCEAFMESHHSLGQHPQLLPGIADVNSQYDLLNDHVSRHISALAVASPMIAPFSEQATLDYMMSRSDPLRRTEAAAAVQLEEGGTARAAFAEMRRRELQERTGRDLSDAAEAELVDSLVYNQFPGFSILGSYAPSILYRWRPNGLDPESTIMDVMMMAPVPEGEPRPRPAPVKTLDFDEPFSSISELGGLSLVFDQDVGNLIHVQRGLRASGNGVIHFSNYSEMRLRHLHIMVDRMIADGRARDERPR